MKYLISLFLVFYFAGLSAQSEQNFILNTNIGYNYAYEDKADDYPFDMYSVPRDKTINNLEFSVAIGKKFKSNFYYGIGFALNLQKTEVYPGINKPYYDSEFGYYYRSYNNVFKDYVYSPLVYLQYITNLGERFKMTVTLISQYDFEKSFAKFTRYEPVSFENYTTSVNTDESKREYISALLVPGFKLNLYKSFGMNVSFGSMAYRIKTAESLLPDIKKSREFAIDFKPENWTLGFHLYF
ncbi:MAG: hypothetical protein ABR597_07290 [Bacteroidales bacterium]